MADIQLEEWYNAEDAAKRLSANSGKTIKNEYVRTLAKYGKIRRMKLGSRATLYWKADVDNYKVEERGENLARRKRIEKLERHNRKEDEHAA